MATRGLLQENEELRVEVEYLRLHRAKAHLAGRNVFHGDRSHDGPALDRPFCIPLAAGVLATLTVVATMTASG